MEIKNAPANEQVEEMDKVFDVSRRRFFQLAGGIAGAGLLLSACRKHLGPTDTFIGEDDVALLNLFYIIQQLEAAFYTQAVATPYYGLTVSESQLLTDVRDQEIAHREYVKKLLGNKAVKDISVNFSDVVFAERQSVLQYASVFEDLSIAACNGSAHFYKDTQYVLAFSKIATVEARHSAYFRDLHTYNSFADSTAVDIYGLDLASTPAAVFERAKPYIHTTFDARNLPN